MPGELNRPRMFSFVSVHDYNRFVKKAGDDGREEGFALGLQRMIASLMSIRNGGLSKSKEDMALLEKDLLVIRATLDPSYHTQFDKLIKHMERMM